MNLSENLIVIGYAKLPAASASHSVHEYVSIVLRVDRSTGRVFDVDSTAVTALVRAFIRDLLLGQDVTQSVEPILTEIDRSYLGHAAGSIKQAVTDAWRRYARASTADSFSGRCHPVLSSLWKDSSCMRSNG